MGKLSDALKKVQTNGLIDLTDSTQLTTLGALIDNDLADSLTVDEWSKWREFAESITGAMSENDEPRFTLYDYLDAIINAPAGENVDLLNALIGLAMNDKRKFFPRLVSLAERKRTVYES